MHRDLVMKGVTDSTKDIINRHPARVGRGSRRGEGHNAVAVNGN